jgi:hypothetical protein
MGEADREVTETVGRHVARPRPGFTMTYDFLVRIDRTQRLFDGLRNSKAIRLRWPDKYHGAPGFGQSELTLFNPSASLEKVAAVFPSPRAIRTMKMLS